MTNIGFNGLSLWMKKNKTPRTGQTRLAAVKAIRAEKTNEIIAAVETVSKLVDRLLKKNLVKKSEFFEDCRYQEIHLTAKAIQLVPRFSGIADENDAKFFSVLSESERCERVRLRSEWACKL